MVHEDEAASYEAFIDAVSTTVIAKLAPRPSKGKKRAIKGRKNEIKPVALTRESNEEDDAGDLSDFVEV